MKTASFLAMCPWDIEVWFASDSYNGLELDAQGAYMNLCFRAFQRQPTCTVPDDDSKLWRLAGCRSPDQWRELRTAVLGAGGWDLGPNGWTHPTVTATYKASVAKHERAVRAGRIAGKQSARIRREIAKQKKVRQTAQTSTTVERPLNDRATIFNPPSPSPSPSPSITTTETTNNGSVPTDVGTGLQLTSLDVENVKATAKTMNESQAAKLVFDFWRMKTGQTRAQWTDERRRRLITRLREEPGDMVAKVRGLCLAVEGALRDPFHNGSIKGTAYLGFENLFVHQGRDRIEKLQRAALAEDGPAPGAAGAPRDELEAGNRRAADEAVRRYYEEHPDERPTDEKPLQAGVGFARVLPQLKGGR